MPTSDNPSLDNVNDENKDFNIEASIPNIKIKELEAEANNIQVKDSNPKSDEVSNIKTNEPNLTGKTCIVQTNEPIISGEEVETNQAFRDIVDNAMVEVTPPATGHTTHAGAFGDYFHAKRNKTKIIHFPSWESPNQSPEFKLYIAKCELLRVTNELSETRRQDAQNRLRLAEQGEELRQKQEQFSELIVNTEPFIQQNKEIWTRFDRIISRNETKDALLKEKTKVLIEDTKKFSKWEILMKILVDLYQPFKTSVSTCLTQSSSEFHDLESLMNSYMSKLYAKYELLGEFYESIHCIDETQHHFGKEISRHNETMKQLSDKVSTLRTHLRELTSDRIGLEEQLTLLMKEKQIASLHWIEIQKSLDNAYKLFILDNPERQRTKSKPKQVSTNTNTIRLEDKVSQLQTQHDYLNQVLQAATGLYESASDTMRAHVSVETISF
uniref:Uncharacterized protein n=1 Tax=Cacopsylla melanoneura TaxID=428564 RepID=A0A8D9F3V9_9HEMI